MEAIPIEELATRLLVGDPESCVKKLREYEALGFDEFVVDPIGDHQQTMRSLRLLREEVMPHFRKKRLPDGPHLRPLGMPPHGRTQRITWRKRPMRTRTDSPWIGGRGTLAQWLAHVEAAAAAGDPRRCYVFDFAIAPRVKGESTPTLIPRGSFRALPMSAVRSVGGPSSRSFTDETARPWRRCATQSRA